eukprot:TRINITY_DN5021_c0_g1_i3.p4 TRINITY_DN5021_c0_g1~~TRINITY_DN5021_c0_g1_i3.p4  ORF type:complete len:122 (-),score=0.79 TRINITY_DN5021_c0_g1_i3:391-756(-)
MQFNFKNFHSLEKSQRKCQLSNLQNVQDQKLIKYCYNIIINMGKVFQMYIYVLTQSLLLQLLLLAVQHYKPRRMTIYKKQVYLPQDIKGLYRAALPELQHVSQGIVEFEDPCNHFLSYMQP